MVSLHIPLLRKKRLQFNTSLHISLISTNRKLNVIHFHNAVIETYFIKSNRQLKYIVGYPTAQFIKLQVYFTNKHVIGLLKMYLIDT